MQPVLKCANCGKPIDNPKTNSRFCAEPGSTCRQEFHRMRLPRAAVDIAVGRWFSDNQALLVQALLPPLTAAIKDEIRRAVRAGMARTMKRKRRA